jgi:hypothetical protein
MLKIDSEHPVIRGLRILLEFVQRLSFESVAATFAVFSIAYASRLLILNSFYSFATDARIFILSALPIWAIVLLLTVGGLANLIAIYRQITFLFFLSVYWLLLIWAAICASFLLISWLNLHFFISSYVILVYSWVLWRAQGLVSPKP